MVWLTAPQLNSYQTYKCHSILLSLTFSGALGKTFSARPGTLDKQYILMLIRKPRREAWVGSRKLQHKKMSAQELEGKNSVAKSFKPETNPQGPRGQDPLAITVLHSSEQPPPLKSFLSASLSCPAPIFNSYLPTTSPSHGLRGRQNAISIPWVGGKKSFNLPCGEQGETYLKGRTLPAFSLRDTSVNSS